MNKTNLPNNSKPEDESLTSFSSEDYKVHHNLDKPEKLQAHTHTQKTSMHITSEQEKYLPHEAWLKVQRKQGRVKPDKDSKGKVEWK